MPDENAKTYNSIFGRHLLVIDDDKNKLSIWMQIKFFYRNHCRCSLKVYSACLRMCVILFLLLFSDLCSSPSLENVIETAKGEGRERVYIIEPTGEFENDPNVTDKKFPGNLTRSYRSQEPLRIIGEETEWTKLTTTERREWRENLDKHKGKIIN